MNTMRPLRDPGIIFQELREETLLRSPEVKAIHILIPPAQFISELCSGMLYGPPRAGRTWPPQRESASPCVDPAARGASRAEPRREARAVGFLRQRVNRPLIDRALSQSEWASGVRCRRRAAVPTHGVRLKTAPLCASTPSGPRQKSVALRRVLLCADGTDLLPFPLLCACGAKRGQPARVALTGSNARRSVFGALNVYMGRWLLRVRARQQGEDFWVSLQTLHRHYHGWHVVLVLDPDRVHPASAAQYLAAQLGIELLWLAPRCPARNPLEPLWRSGTQTICANRQCQTIDGMVERFLVYLHWLAPREARRKAGPLSHPCASPMCEICSASLLKTFAKYLGVD